MASAANKPTLPRDQRPSVNRRGFLRLSAVAGEAAFAVGVMATPAAAANDAQAAQPTAAPDPANGVRLFDDPDFNFNALFALGGVAYGAGDVGEIFETVNVINARGPSYQSYYDSFLATARRVSQIADEAAKAGHHISARSAYLRSAQYFDQALYFVLGTTTPQHEALVAAAMDRMWDRAAQLFEPAFEPVTIQYENTTLPGYFLTPPGRRIKRPTVIITNGSDKQHVDLWAYGAAAALERGYNVLLFYGPGQGTTLFQRGIGFRPDWERVITPVVDHLYHRPDVDTGRIALVGSSFGGELVVRAAAFEKRIAAVCSDPGSVDTWLAYPEHLRSLFHPGATANEVNSVWNQQIVPSLDAGGRFAFAKRPEIYSASLLRQARRGEPITDFWTFGQLAMRFTNAHVLERVTAPVLVTSYELEQFYAGQAAQLYAALTSPKTLVRFTVAEGAQYHDAPQAPQRHNQVILDWLDDTLGR
jgi:dienelactone hydrolase